MELDTEDFHFWKLVLSVSDSIASDMEQRQLTKDELLNYLGTIEEVFRKSNDPVSNFQKFVLLELCRSLRKSLAHL